MSTLAPTSQTAGGTAKRVTIGSVCKAAAAAAVVGMISVFSITLLSRAQFAPPVAIDTAPPPELRSLLCRIDRRCTATDLTHQPLLHVEAGDQTGIDKAKDILK